MKNKKLLDLLDNYFSFDEKNNLQEYILTNFDKISQNDLKKTILSLLNKNIFFYADIRKYQDIINNIDNKTWLNNESNYI